MDENTFGVHSALTTSTVEELVVFDFLSESDMMVENAFVYSSVS